MDKAREGGPPSVIKYNEIYHTIGQNVTISTIVVLNLAYKLLLNPFESVKHLNQLYSKVVIYGS